MEHVVRIAGCILNEAGGMSTMKLQKLVYYSQAQHLVSCGTTLFPERIEAWANGPVVPELFDRHRGRFLVKPGFLGEVRATDLPADEARSVFRVIECLGGKTGEQLSELTHAERPWLDARAGLGPYDRSNRVIEPAAMQAFYGSGDCTNPLFAPAR